MTNRFTQALRVLLGRPQFGLALDSTTLLHALTLSEYDFTKRPPRELLYFDAVADAPPIQVVRAKCFRVSIFSEANGEKCDCCGGCFHWLVFEILAESGWHRLLTMHDSNLCHLLDLLEALGKFFASTNCGGGSLSPPTEA